MSRIRWKSTNFVVWLSALALTIGPNQVWGQRDDQAPAIAKWVPNDEILKKLDKEIKVSGKSGFRIRPPKGYVKQALEYPADSGVSGMRWEGPRRRDGSQVRLLVIIGTRELGERPSEPEEFAKNFFRSREESVGPIKLEPREKGTIDGVLFTKVAWSATHPTTRVKSSGFLYFANPGQLDVMLDSQDIEPHMKETLKLVETSALTFRLGDR